MEKIPYLSLLPFRPQARADKGRTGGGRYIIKKPGVCFIVNVYFSEVLNLFLFHLHHPPLSSNSSFLPTFLGVWAPR
jgi:hypothetical protein